MKPDYPARYAAAVNFAAAHGKEARPGSLAKSLRAAKSGAVIPLNVPTPENLARTGPTGQVG